MVFTASCCRDTFRNQRPTLWSVETMKMISRKQLLASLSLGALASISMTAQGASHVSTAIANAYSSAGVATGTPVALIAEDEFFVDFVDVNSSGSVDAGDRFQGVIQLGAIKPAGEFDASSDIIDDVTPTGPSQGFTTGLYGIFDVEISDAPVGQFLFSADSGSVVFRETTTSLLSIGTSFAADKTAIEGAAGSTVIAEADFSGGGSTFWSVDTTTTPVVDAFDISLNFSSESGLLPAGFSFAENELGTELFGTIGSQDNFFFLPGSSNGSDPFGSGYFAGGDGDFAIVVVPSPSAAAFGLLGLTAIGIRRRRTRKTS
jgi:MYXO-CTERM domain-containing protein